MRKEAKSRDKDASSFNTDNQEQVAIEGQAVGMEEITFDLDDSFSKSDMEEKMAEKQAIQDVDNVDGICTKYNA